jgi:uncharacterized protein YbbC (DUF1343 family)
VLFQLGIEHIGTQLDAIKNKKIALITNQTGVDQTGQRSIDLLLAQGFNVVMLCAPEHGLSGSITAGKQVIDERDSVTELPAVSLYRGGDKNRSISQDILDSIDIFFYDIQDCGMRHYTYISTLYKVLECAAIHDKSVVVFDRPNLLGPIMEGPSVEPDLISFVSIAPIPLRYGLTVGELACYFNTQVLTKPAQLTVIAMDNYQRTMRAPQLIHPLSPNITSRHACWGYSFLGLLEEIAPFFAGHGTKRSFGYILLPEQQSLTKKQWQRIARIFERVGIATRPARVYREKRTQWYTGLALSFDGVEHTPTFSLLLRLLKEFKRMGVAYTPSQSFDKCVGSHAVRQYLTEELSFDELAQQVNSDLELFYTNVQDCLLYTPKPRMVKLKIAQAKK